MKSRPASTHGFALVIALSLMAFILLLILSITTLVRVETQSANIQLAQLKARMNAQLGAMVALGDLQRYTGPDQRVTARADILLAPGADETDLPTAGQQRWTGVWSSKQSTSDALDTADGLEGHKARWLVSGNGNNPSVPTLDPNVAITVETANLASLGGSVTNKSNQDDTVKAPKVEILGDDDVTEGHYAYWVSDEGVKARVNMADPFLDSDPYDPNNPDTYGAYYRTAMAQVADPTAVSNSADEQLLTSTSSRWKDEAQDPGKISSLKNIPIFTDDNLPSDEFFHDFTVHSSGVLANTKDGGLKRDLSTALLNLPNDMKGPMFEPFGATQSTGDPGGPNWEQLADYYQVARSTMNSSSLQFRMPTTQQVGIAPVVTRWNLPFYGFADYNGAGDEWTTGGYNYSIGLFPLITLWNPYNKDLVLPEMGIECEFPRKLEIWSCRYAQDGVPILQPIKDPAKTKVYVTPSRQSVAQIQLAQWPPGGGTTYRNVIKFRIKSVTIPAGQAYNFTPPINSIFDYQVSNEGRNNILVHGGWSGSNMNGFYTDPVAGSGTEEILMKPLRVVERAGIDQVLRESWKHTTQYTMPSISRVQDEGGELWQPVLNLYDLSTDDTFNLDGSNRFKSLTFWGLNDQIGDGLSDKNEQQQGLNPRVMRLNRIGNNGINALLLDSPRFSNFLQPLGSSDGASYSDPGTNPAVDLTAVDHWKMAGKTFGISAALKFPDMPFHSTQEVPIHLYRNFNPTAPVSMRSIKGQTDYWGDIATMYTRGSSTTFGGDNTSNYLPGTEYANAQLGLEFGLYTTSGSDEAVLYDISKPLSIGHLMHANLFNYYGANNDLEISNGSSTSNYKYHSNSHQALYAIPVYAIGNSFPDIYLPLNESKLNPSANIFTTDGGASVKWCHYDYSYELNSALWDGYYFSGIDPAEPTSFPLPNARLRDVAYNGATTLTDEKQAAARLLLDGAFNINSTSIAAWESILGAMRDIENVGGGIASSGDQSHNFSRFTEALVDSTGTVPDLGADADSLAAGFRSLSDAQIASLASEIVTEIRLRTQNADPTGFTYPFTSVSNFVNRSLDYDMIEGDPIKRAFAFSGVLQAAIDKSGINGLKSDSSGLWETTNLDFYPLYEEGDLTAEQRPRTDGMPGSLTQADLLNKIGHLLQARSDTFVIRSSGDTVDEFSSGANQSSAQAYYEIIVQRTPAYVDSSQLAYDPATSVTNEKFGRKYQIVSQGWVSSEDI